jgi:uncharacterized protein YkwD
MKYFILALIAVILSACSLTEAPTNPTEKPKTTNPSGPREVPGDTTPLNETLAEMAALINEARGQDQQCGSDLMRATTPLIYNSLIARAAQKHAEDMAYGDYTGHVTKESSTYFPVGFNSWDRMASEGFPLIQNYGGENITMVNESPIETINAWLNSSEHCKNLMNPNYTYMGLGRITEKETGDSFTWEAYNVLNMAK